MPPRDQRRSARHRPESRTSATEATAAASIQPVERTGHLGKPLAVKARTTRPPMTTMMSMTPSKTKPSAPRPGRDDTLRLQMHQPGWRPRRRAAAAGTRVLWCARAPDGGTSTRPRAARRRRRAARPTSRAATPRPAPPHARQPDQCEAPQAPAPSPCGNPVQFCTAVSKNPAITAMVNPNTIS